MGCDYTPPTVEEARAIDAALRRRAEERAGRVKEYEAEMRKLIEGGLHATVGELVSIVLYNHRIAESEIYDAARSIFYSGDYGLPDNHWRIGK